MCLIHANQSFLGKYNLKLASKVLKSLFHWNLYIPEEKWTTSVPRQLYTLWVSS